MIAAIIILAWLLINTVASLIIICLDGGTPVRGSDWLGIALSCTLSPVVILFVIQPIINYIKRKNRKKK